MFAAPDSVWQPSPQSLNSGDSELLAGAAWLSSSTQATSQKILKNTQQEQNHLSPREGSQSA